MYLTFAWRYFKAKKSANAINIISWVTISVIAFATFCQLLVLSVFNGFEDLVKDSYSSFYSDIKIVPKSGKSFLLTASQLNLIKQQSFVNYFSGVAEEKALLQNGEAQSVVYLKGVDDNYKNVSGVAQKISKGKYSLGTIDEPLLVVGSGIQNAAGINIDGAFTANDLTIILPKKNTESNDPLQSLSEGTTQASGVFAIQQEFDNKYAVTNIDFVKRQMNFLPNEYSAVEIKLKPDADPKKSKETLFNLLGKDLIVQNKYEQNTSLYTTMQLEKWAIYAVLTLILIIAAFNMISALTMLVLEKQKDISVLQSFGATNKTILKIFLSEGVLLGLIGSVVGIALALLISFAQLKWKLIPLKGGTFLVNYFPVKTVATDILLVAFTAILIAFAAAWFPAYKASKQKIELK
ncbi:MAG: ABC transporter permease [Chitinophagaceae bacterium]|nr:ABC transporter permease [Chitinophagaceae bacterium]